MAVCRMHNITRSFRGTTALEGLSLTLEAGETYGLLGPNGAGKTTAIRILLGLLRPDAGTVELFGGPPDTKARLRVGYVPATRSLPEPAQVEETLVFVARMRGRSAGDARQAAASWIDRMELGHRRAARIDTLSSGEQQKVQLALAFFGEPDLLVLDEPLTALDPTHQEIVLSVLRERVRAGATVLLATHRLWEAEAIVKHVFLLHEGRKVVDSTLREALVHNDRYRLVTQGPTDWLHGPGVEVLDTDVDGAVVFRCASLAPVLGRAAVADAQILQLTAQVPSLHDLFLEHVVK